jgi:FkbM family methyltransferase
MQKSQINQYRRALSWARIHDWDEFSGHPDQTYGHITYAQHGEDLILMNYFAMLHIDKPTYLDIGAHHPINISNTALLYTRGARGVNVEANPNLIGNFYRLRPEDINLNVGVGDSAGYADFYMYDDHSGLNSFDKTHFDNIPGYPYKSIMRIEVMTLDDIVERYCNGIFPDFLNLDTEGWDYKILAAADFSKTNPKLICTEMGEDNAVKHFLNERGYAMAAKTIANVIFVRKEFEILYC